MSKTTIHKLLTYGIAAVWLANGLFCKVLNLVPRHEQIVAKILGADHSRSLTVLIGLSEIVMAAWIILGYQRKLNAIAQIIVVVVMNTLEFILVPELLLWGKLNSFFACIFVLVVYFNELYLNKKPIS
jgi:uncharacterized membrane protein YphA (DoxX/SURF4 family)